MSKASHGHPHLNILLSNGRFPVAIDLARQLKLAGHTIFVVDPMQFHICRFSRMVNKSFHVPAPHYDATGYIAAVKSVVVSKNIDLIIPLHEETFYLAECEDREILDRLFAPPFKVLVTLHDKWEFNRFLHSISLDAPQASLFQSIEDVKNLDLTREWALKPVFGRAAIKVFHLGPGRPLPDEDNFVISNEERYIAQEWIHGSRYCTYSILRGGQLRALAIYAVQDTLDGSSCVYFESVKHSGIQAYIERVATALPGVTGQIALDMIETKLPGNDVGRLIAIECNPRATSGIHLFSGCPDLANCITEPADSITNNQRGILTPPPGANRQVAPGMLMVPRKAYDHTRQYLAHLKRLMLSRDVTFSAHDMLPSLMQPFLLTSYYEICREKRGMTVKEMFQDDFIWEPVGEHLERVRMMLEGKGMSGQDSEKDLRSGGPNGLVNN